jgi:HD-GYP domain-containing protein (c-di-GMP phosphodiesterase class II)
MRSLPLHEKLSGLVKTGIALNSIRDVDTLLETVVEAAMGLCGADGGTLYLARDGALAIHITRNRTLEARLGREGMANLYGKFILPISQDSMAGFCALTGQTLNFADMHDLPPGTHFRHNKALDRRAGYDTRSQLTVPMHDRTGQCVGVLQMINAMEGDTPGPFNGEDEALLQAFAAQAGVSIQNTQLDELLRKSHQETLFRLSSAAEYRDRETSNHIKRMSHYSRLVAERIGLRREEVESIFQAAPMHDVGKLGIPDSILHKPGPLDPEERTIMESHAIIGARILEGSDVPVVRQAAVVAITHHEKWDGTGYPYGLSGRDIPLEGRIVALADVFDALSSRRCYKAAWPEDRVLEFLVEQKARHFDPELVECLLGAMPEVRAIMTVHEDTDDDFAMLESPARALIQSRLPRD